MSRSWAQLMLRVALHEPTWAASGAEHRAGFTLIPDALGCGASGSRMGPRAFPGSNNVYLAVVPRAQADSLIDVLRKLRSQPGADFRVFAIDATEVM